MYVYMCVNVCTYMRIAKNEHVCLCMFVYLCECASLNKCVHVCDPVVPVDRVLDREF